MINPLMIFGLALGYLLLKVYLEKRWAPLDDAGDDRHLADLAFACGCNVFDIFKSAGAQWNFSVQKAERDFRRYLRTGHVPTYVHRYVTGHRLYRNSTYQRLIFNGGRPPYL
jgi:hypothetical protein